MELSINSEDQPAQQPEWTRRVDRRKRQNTNNIINHGSKENNKHSILNYCPRNNLSKAVEKVGEMPATITPYVSY